MNRHLLARDLRRDANAADRIAWDLEREAQVCGETERGDVLREMVQAQRKLAERLRAAADKVKPKPKTRPASAGSTRPRPAA